MRACSICVEEIKSRPRCRPGSAQSPARIADRIIYSEGARKCPYGGQWSELQRDDRMAAESACHPSAPSKSSLLAWQGRVAMAAPLRSCSDQRRLPRRMQARRAQLQFGPTSRARDSVWFLFPCRDFDPISNFSKLIPGSTSCFQASPLPPSSGEIFQSVHRKCSRRMLFRRAFASSLRLPPVATSLS